MGEIITFYSYKGGVGRSSTLANTAVLLTRWGYKTLVVDWDLEAPGLEFFYKDFIDVRFVSSKRGIVDLLTRGSQRHVKAEGTVTWMDLLVDIKLPQESGPLRMLKAGRVDRGYFRRLRKFDVNNFYKRKQGGSFIEQLRNQWREAFDFILIDSRTGITDIGGICTVQLPDILILFFTANEQAFQGAIDVAMKAHEARQNLPIDRLKLLCVPIASKFDSDKEFRLSQQYLSEFALQLSDLYADWLPKEVSPNIFLQATKVPYIPYFSFGSKLAVIDQGLVDPSGLGYSYETLAALIANNLEHADEVVSDRSHFLRRATASAEYGGPIFHGIEPPLGNSDKDFQLRVEQIIASQNDGEFNVLLEKVRDQTVGLWRARILSEREVDNQVLQHIKNSEFLPAMRALAFLGLMIVKYGALEYWFEKLVDVLIDIFDVGTEIHLKLPLGDQNAKAKTLDSNHTATTLGLEALITANLLGSYDLTKNKSVKYFSKLFERVVRYPSDFYDEQQSTFFLFWPYFYRSPNIFIDLLVAERYANGSIVEDYFSTPEALKISVLQANCLLEWHSFLSFQKLNELRAGEPETVQFFKDKYPSVSTIFHPSFFHEPPPLLTPLVLRLWETVSRRSESFLSLDPELDSVIATIDIDRRKKLLGRFLISVRRQHVDWMFQQQRHPYLVDWPREIQEVISSINSSD